MSEQRYNVFNMIHKALRALFYDTAVTIQRTDFDQPEANAAIKKIEMVLQLLEEHSHHEDEFILPLVMTTNVELSNDFKKDHEVDHKLVEDLLKQIEDWRNATTAQQKIEAGSGIFMSFNEFIAFNLYHMNKEETLLLFALWKQYTDEELLNTSQQIVAKIQPQTLAFESEWMIRSNSNQEIINWLMGVKLSGVERVYDQLLLSAKNILPAERFNLIYKSLGSEMALS